MSTANPAQEKYLRSLIYARMDRLALKKLYGHFYSTHQVMAIIYESLIAAYKFQHPPVQLGYGALHSATTSDLISRLKNWPTETIIIPDRYSVKIYNKKTGISFDYAPALV